VPTAPANLPALQPDAGGASVGFNVQGVPPSPVPEPAGGTIIDQDAAIRLGKALFWDMQTGSDGQIACASCHFSGGADNRTVNTVHPGPDALFNPAVVAGPGATFNFITFDAGAINDVVGSSGVISRLFGSISADLTDPVDVCTPLVHGDPAQALFGTDNRLVTGRNTPPAIGAVFYLDNFWDGRASQNFNGLDPLGDGPMVAGLSSLASQSVGPPLSDVEMSCAGRTWNGPNSLGAKLVPRTPLANQLVDPTDSVLGPLSNAPGNGLDCGFADRLCTYADLIAAAFGTNGLSGQAAVDSYIDNFSSIWGQAVQAYEATLVPNRTPYDLGTLSPVQLAGLNEFRANNCVLCHVEPEFSDATVRLINLRGGPNVQKVVNGGPGGDQGFHNIGASVTANDRGRAASPGGTYHVSAFNEGAFKTPGLRNLALTAPYMHNGSIASINQVLEFYDGNGQVANPEINPDAQNGVGGGRQAEVVAFLTTGLLDCRVANELAPFDHPSLVIPNGTTLEAAGAAGNGTICP
jgi:cytochrome c peroxidase